MYPIAIAAANRGHTRVLEWLWQKSLFTVEDLKKTARRASIFASQRADLDLLNWYHAKLAIHVPRFHWRFKERFLRQTARTEDVRVTQWWYMHSTAYIERMQLEFSLTDAGSVQGLEWLYEQGRLKIQHWGPLDMVLRAPTLGTLFFWIRYCTAHPDQVLFHWWPHLSSPTRPIYFETVWSIFEQRGHSVHDVFKNALARSKDPQLAVWLQAKVASLQN
ncbi:hypothetical protein BC828DRAFT_386578 [Blastocladiella britannica]|nr:hypothetical protein BC828DRAFT_386578 [Blastocladiella britannica]